MIRRHLIRRHLILPAIMLGCATAATAQGFISDSQTGTLVIYRDPARQASTEIDAVVNNPAGTAFLPQGLSFSAGVSCDFGVQKAIIPDNPLFDFKSNSYTVGPIMQLAWRKGAVALSASLGHSGGYGRRSLKGSPYVSFNLDRYNFDELNQVLLSLNSQVAPYISYFEEFNDNRVCLRTMKDVASLYNWDARLGAAFSLGNNVAVYAGLKLNRVYNGQGTTVVAAVEAPEIEQFTSWDAYISTITYDIMNDDGHWVTEGHQPMTPEQKQYYVEQYLALPTPEPEEVKRITFRNNCLSLAPVIGVDVRTDAVNFGAKYEFASVARHGAYKVPAMVSAGVDLRTSPVTRLAIGASAVMGQEYFYGPAKDRLVYNITASVSWLPVSEWVLSTGLTYSHRNEWAPEAIAYTDPDPHSLMFLSLGCGYNFNRQVQFNFGMRSGLGQAGFSSPESSTMPVRYTVRYPVQFAFGLNLYFKS